MIEKLVNSLKSDVDYRRSWIANIAVSFQDEVHRYRKKTGKKYLNAQDIHTISNTAAEEFLTLLCRDTKEKGNVPEEG